MLSLFLRVKVKKNVTSCISFPIRDISFVSFKKNVKTLGLVIATEVPIRCISITLGSTLIQF